MMDVHETVENPIEAIAQSARMSVVTNCVGTKKDKEKCVVAFQAPTESGGL